jgi:hypothetical protein
MKMMVVPRTVVFFAIVIAASATTARAQSANYSSVEVLGTTLMQLSYHASAHNNCTPAPLPTVRVIQPPTSGTLTVRRAILTTDKVASCPAFKIPAQVVFYRARAGYAGPDHVVYEVTDANGEVSSYDVTIKVKETQNSVEKPKDSKI